MQSERAQEHFLSLSMFRYKSNRLPGQSVIADASTSAPLLVTEAARYVFIATLHGNAKPQAHMGLAIRLLFF